MTTSAVSEAFNRWSKAVRNLSTLSVRGLSIFLSCFPFPRLSFNSPHSLPEAPSLNNDDDGDGDDDDDDDDEDDHIYIAPHTKLRKRRKAASKVSYV